jgi:predicted metal-dependent hydrolase
VNDALVAIEDDPSGYLSIRGHISLIEGRPDEALADFERSRAMKELALNTKGVGETQADIALVHMRRGNVREAARMLRESVTILEDTKSYTFAIRVRKRLAQALLLSGHPLQAWNELNTAHDMAVRNHVYDQITPVMEMANRIAVGLGIKPKVDF